jgi:predicted enzyme related to lactoylglutathione lyase
MSDWPRPVVAFQINVRDREKQRAFYSAMFDWDITEREGIPVLAIPPGKGPPVEGVGGTMVQTESPAVMLYVQVADLAASLKQAVELGGRVVLERLDVPNGPTIGQIADPEGNLLGLVQM